jgi:hypothetical protein
MKHVPTSAGILCPRPRKYVPSGNLTNAFLIEFFHELEYRWSYDFSAVKRQGGPMLRHIVFMKFKTGVDALQIENMQQSLGALPGKIDEIKGFEFGPDILKSERSYDFALVASFTDLDSLKRYQVHPDHIPVLQKVRSLCESILVVDFECP